MTKKAKVPALPLCAHCNQPSALVLGENIYRHRRDLAKRSFYKCFNCDAYVGCHRRTSEPLGRPANAELRAARQKLHNLMIDPLWKTAIDACGYTPEDNKARAIITKAARARVYHYLAMSLGIERSECHVAMFDLETCRAAWRALKGKAYSEIRAWAKALKAQEAA